MADNKAQYEKRLKNILSTKERPSRYIRLLSYENACKVIDFICKYDDEDYACITPGGVCTQVSDENWPKAVEFIQSLEVRYEVSPDHPSVTTARIVDNLKRANIID